jgi:hypothetical protein
LIADAAAGRETTTKEDKMLKTATLCLGLMLAGFDLAAAQDIPGIEDCTKTTGLDKRTGCFQSNINFLQQTMTRNALDARQRLSAANNEIIALKAAVISLQASLEEIRTAQKAAGEKKPGAK